MLGTSILGRVVLRLCGMVLFLGACAAPVEEHAEEHWSYEGDTGPEHWAELDPKWELASRGRQQSPVDMIGPAVVLKGKAR